MRKLIVVFVFFVLLIVIMVGCAPPTFSPAIKLNVAPGDNITDVSIDIDQNGNKHIVGIKDNQVVYFRGKGEPGYKFTIGWGYLVVGTDTSSWEQHQPEIAVFDNGTAHIVWWEHHGDPTKKIACHYEVPPVINPFELIYCHPLDDPMYTSGLVRVTAKDDTAYAVYDRLHSSGYVDSVWYKKIDEMTTTGLIVSYSVVTEEAFIYSLDLAIDNSKKLHLAYIDQATYSPNPRLYYRSNATTNMDGSMSQIWAIEFGAPGLKNNVKPSIHFYNDGSNTFVKIASVWENSLNQMIYVDSCNINGCSDKTNISPTLSNIDWNTSSKILEVKGLGTLNTYTLSFIAYNDLSPIYQVWYWVLPFSGNPTQVTDTNYAKYQLNIVDSLIPIIGYLERWEDHGLVASFSDRVSIYDVNYGVREVKTSVCPGAYTNVSSDMASYVDIMADTLPVAGVWNVCSTTFFSNNAFLVDLPLIMK